MALFLDVAPSGWLHTTYIHTYNEVTDAHISIDNPCIKTEALELCVTSFFQEQTGVTLFHPMLSFHMLMMSLYPFPITNSDNLVLLIQIIPYRSEPRWIQARTEEAIVITDYFIALFIKLELIWNHKYNVLQLSKVKSVCCISSIYIYIYILFIFAHKIKYPTLERKNNNKMAV